MMRAVLIGSGHVAYHFGKALLAKGISIHQVYSRTPEHASVLADILHAETIKELDDIDTHADIYLIAVQDSAIESVVFQLPDALSGIVVHTSGGTSSTVLSRFGRYGVIYPLQSIRKEVDVDFCSMPLAVEGNTESSQERLLSIAQLLSHHALVCTSEQRLVLHLSAVFANNFTNALFGVAHHLTAAYGLSFDLLKPIIFRTVENIKIHAPMEVQTGPAIRNDRNTINTHLEFLKKHPEYKEIYSVISDYIQKIK